MVRWRAANRMATELPVSNRHRLSRAGRLRRYGSCQCDRCDSRVGQAGLPQPEFTTAPGRASSGVVASGRSVGGVTEQQPYNVLEQHHGFELRRYPQHVVAEVELDGSFQDAGNRAFRSLFRYITGANHT